MTEEAKQGWYQDPAGRHEYRWFSQGVPTDLVKDRGTTSRDSISDTDPADYQAMQLAQEPDIGPLLHKDDAPPPEFQVLNVGVGPVVVVNTSASPSDPAVWSERAGVGERILVVLPIFAELLILRVFAFPLIVLLAGPLLSLLIAAAGRWRRVRRVRRRQRLA
jgi:hypothetical protein